MRRLSTACALLIFAAVLPAATLPELFQKAKEQFRLRAYSDALATLATLEAESEKPGAESFRTALRPGLAFYRGASLAALGRADEARPHLEIYLAHNPGAVLDPAIYPKEVVAAVESTRRTLQDRPGETDVSASLAAAYDNFPQPQESGEERLDTWAEGPARFLLTSDERQAFSRLSDPVSQSEYIAQFWKSHDPKPETVENELRLEFERRVAFADSRFTQDETRGAVTDRGMVFILLGPPTWIGRKPLTTGDDATDNAGLSLYTRQDVQEAKNSGGTTGQKAKAMDRFAGPTAKILEPSHNWQEVWHYRRELLPKAVPYHQVDFDFLTRRGYGKNVLQREDTSLKTLEAARRAEAAWFVGNKASR